MNNSDKDKNKKDNAQTLHELRHTVAGEDFFHQRLLNSIGDSVFVHDFEGNFIYVNEPAYKTRGYTKGELMGMSLRQLDTPAFSRFIDARIKELMGKGEVLFEAAHRCKDGKVLPVEIHSRLIQVKGKVLVLSIARDITSRKKAEKKYEMIIKTSIDGFYLTDTQGSLLEVNDAYCQLTGYQKDELLGMRIQDIEAKESPDKVASHIKQIVEKGSDLFESQHRCKDGRVIDVEVRVNYLEMERGSFFSFVRDITEKKRVRRKLQVSEKKLNNIIENANEAILVLQNGKVRFANPKALQASGYKKQELLSTPFLQHVHPEDRELVMERYKRRLKGEVPSPQIYSIRFMCKSGQIMWVQINSVSIEWEGEPAVLSFLTDITRQKQEEKKLSFMATHDSLTGLANRALFTDHVNLAIAKAKREKGMFPVMLFDLDNFKEVNDTLGHSVGDELLKKVTSRLEGILRGTDTLSRMGGDEFLLLLPDTSTRQDTGKVAEKVLAVFQKPFSLGSHSIGITASVGITIYPEDGKDADTLIKKADVAMYRAKEGGKNSYRFYEGRVNGV